MKKEHEHPFFKFNLLFFVKLYSQRFAISSSFWTTYRLMYISASQKGRLFPHLFHVVISILHSNLMQNHSKSIVTLSVESFAKWQL